MEEEIFEGIIDEGMDDVNEDSNGSSGQVIAMLGVGAVVVGAGLAAFIYSQRDKIEQKRVERLRKKGYVVYKPEQIDEQEKEAIEHFEGEIEED